MGLLNTQPVSILLVQFQYSNKQKGMHHVNCIIKPCNCPHRDFTQKAKSWGGVLVARTYVEKYLIMFLLFTPTSRKWLGWCKTKYATEGTALCWFCDTYCTVIFRYSFVLRVFSDMLWSSCFESTGYGFWLLCPNRVTM